MQQAALTNRLQAAPDLIYQLIGAVRRVPKGLASASAFLWGSCSTLFGVWVKNCSHLV